MKKILFFITLFALLYACAKDDVETVAAKVLYEEEELADLSGDEYEPEPEPMPLIGNELQSVGNDIVGDSVGEAFVKKLEKKVELYIVTDSVDREKRMIDRLLKFCGGYSEKERFGKNMPNYDSWNEEKHVVGKGYSLLLRVPTSKLDLFLDSISSGTSGEITRKSIAVTDLSASYYDNLSRKKSKDAALERYRELMKRANSVSEILEIQKQLDNIQEESDLAATQMKRIDNRVFYSTVELDIMSSESVAAKEGNAGVFSQIWDNLKSGWTGLGHFFLILLKLWPLTLALSAGVYFFIKHRRKKKAGK